MSNIFRDSESLGKEVVSDWNIFVLKWSKIAAQKKVCFLLGQRLPQFKNIKLVSYIHVATITLLRSKKNCQSVEVEVKVV